MVIEVLVYQGVILSFNVPAEMMARDRKITFKDEQEWHQRTICNAIAILENEMDRLMIPDDQVSYRITVASKMEDPEAPFY